MAISRFLVIWCAVLAVVCAGPIVSVPGVPPTTMPAVSTASPPAEFPELEAGAEMGLEPDCGGDCLLQLDQPGPEGGGCEMCNVPEPATGQLMLCGLVLAAYLLRKPSRWRRAA
jgi:hypothetical protein